MLGNTPVNTSEQIKLKIYSDVYVTNVRDFPTWIDELFEKTRLPSPLPGLIFACFVYLIGLLLSSFTGFTEIYVSSPPIYLGVFGIAWVSVIIRYSSIKIHSAYEDIRPCFLVSDQEYLSLITKWFNKLISHKANFRFSILLTIIAWTAVYFSFFQNDFIFITKIQSLRPSLFLEGWYFEENRTMKAIIIALYGVFIAFPLGTAIRMLFINMLFVLDLRKLPVIPLPNTIRFRLNKITNLYITITLSWFLGVALFGILLFHELDPFSIVVILVLSSLGLFTFLFPQIIYRLFLIRSTYLASKWLLTSFYKRFGIEIQEKIKDNENDILQDETGCEITDMDNLGDYFEASAHPKFWVYDPWDFILLIIGQGFAIVSVDFEKILGNFF